MIRGLHSEELEPGQRRPCKHISGNGLRIVAVWGIHALQTAELTHLWGEFQPPDTWVSRQKLSEQSSMM